MSRREIMAAKLKEARDASGMTAEQVGEKVGKSHKTVYSWESGQGQPDADTLVKLCRIYNMNIADFYDAKRITSDDFSYIDVPLYGSIAAGVPIEMIEIEGFFAIPTVMHDKYPDSFLLEIKGESMNKKLPNGSYALINPTMDVIDNRAYAVCVNGFDATVKRVRKLENGFELIPDSTDPTFKSKVYDYGEEGTEEITIIGRVVWYCIPFDFEIQEDRNGENMLYLPIQNWLV